MAAISSGLRWIFACNLFVNRKSTTTTNLFVCVSILKQQEFFVCQYENAQQTLPIRSSLEKVSLSQTSKSTFFADCLTCRFYFELGRFYWHCNKSKVGSLLVYWKGAGAFTKARISVISFSNFCLETDVVTADHLPTSGQQSLTFSWDSSQQKNKNHQTENITTFNAPTLDAFHAYNVGVCHVPCFCIPWHRGRFYCKACPCLGDSINVRVSHGLLGESVKGFLLPCRRSPWRVSRHFLQDSFPSLSLLSSTAWLLSSCDALNAHREEKCFLPHVYV